MRPILVLAALLAAAQAAAPRQASAGVDVLGTGALTIDEWLTQCFESKEEVRYLAAVACKTYVSGLIDGYAMTQASIPMKNDRLFCAPKQGVSIDGVVEVIAEMRTTGGVKGSDTLRSTLLGLIRSLWPCA